MSNISDKMLAWFDQFGRKNLPWQQQKTPYRVWVSEIMLQQTQVTTVIPYYNKFMVSFPALLDLANAAEDEVLSHWSGLGYYARARNLHKSARLIRDDYQGVFPVCFDEVLALPGIGRSTAGAILSLSLNQHHVILDGNVKRVLSRLHKVDGWAGQVGVMNQLWTIAEKHTPQERVADYNQAMMDLGASLCARGKKVACARCPLQIECEAYRDGVVSAYPKGKPKKQIPVRKAFMLMVYDEMQGVYLEKRPPAGIWGGLWCFPQCELKDDITSWCEQSMGYSISSVEYWDDVRHTFSHFHLDMTPVLLKIENPKNIVMEDQSAVWYKLDDESARGYATPTMKLLDRLRTELGE